MRIASGNSVAGTSARSHLLKTTSTVRGSRPSRSATSATEPRSRTGRVDQPQHRSLRPTAVALASTPSPSSRSADSRSPAVSINSTGQPSNASDTDTASRVVPGIGETMLRSNPARAFRSVLFPAFGAPAMATVHGSTRCRPTAAFRRRTAANASASGPPASICLTARS